MLKIRSVNEAGGRAAFSRKQNRHTPASRKDYTSSFARVCFCREKFSYCHGALVALTKRTRRISGWVGWVMEISIRSNLCFRRVPICANRLENAITKRRKHRKKKKRKEKKMNTTRSKKKQHR